MESGEGIGDVVAMKEGATWISSAHVRFTDGRFW